MNGKKMRGGWYSAEEVFTKALTISGEDKHRIKVTAE